MEITDEKTKENSITIGEMAARFGVTVRTLQYYHKEGLLTPSAITEGGRRFYTKNDIVKLHQILSMKYLGFSLQDIKTQLTEMNSPQDMIYALEVQKQMFREQIIRLNKALEDTEILQQEVKLMHTVDFDRYAKIILMLRQKSESYWLFKLFNEKLSKHVSELFSENPQEWAELYQRWELVCDRTIALKEQGEEPAGEKAQNLAEEWWNITLVFTGGELSLLPELIKFEEDSFRWNENMKKKLVLCKEYRNEMLRVYFEKNNHNKRGKENERTSEI